MKEKKVIDFPLKNGGKRARDTFMEIAERLEYDAGYLESSEKTAQGVSDVSGNLRSLAEWLRRLI